MTPTAKSRISNADSTPLIQILFLKVCSEADISAISFVRFDPPIGQSVSRETFWYDGRAAQKHYYKAAGGMVQGFGPSKILR
jgi:hypothetical protein